MYRMCVCVIIIIIRFIYSQLSASELNSKYFYDVGSKNVRVIAQLGSSCY